jgi:hypothetical protein
MGNTLSYFLRPHMALLLLLVVLAALGVTWLLRERLGSRPSQALFFGVLVSVGIIVQVTLLRDGLPPGLCLECLTQWNLGRAGAGAVGTEVWLNVVLFVPLGLLATLLWRRPLRVLGAAVLLSVLVETVQSVSVGVADLLDVIANSLGALVGTWLAAVLLLARDTVSSERIERSIAVWVLIVPVVTLAIGWGGSALVATTRQDSVVRRLEEAFAGTTLADYERWETDDVLAEEVFSLGTPWASSASRADSVARVTFPASFYFAERCVVGTWVPDGFLTERLQGPECSQVGGR